MSSYEISKSSLLSLKAEILRKQDELAKAKIGNVEKIKSIKKKALELKNKGVEDRQLNDLNEEEQDLLTLSKSKLEAKSKLYDKLSGNSQDEETSRRYLVRFDKKEKVQNDPDASDVPDLPVDSEEEENPHSDYYDDEVDSADEWVEYTDCLGRSRKCLRKDLEYIKSQDADLKLSADKRQQNQPCENAQTEIISLSDSTEEPEQVQVINDEKEMISGDMRRDMLRQEWEKEEEELKNKSDIHYQNVLFNEARQHGVGYYAFSKDEDERIKQQEALKRIRIETAQQQKKAQDLKALREKQLAARMKAARNRRRARLGLPPEEDEPAPTEPSKEPENENKKNEEEEKSEATEKILAEARKRHVRPWDVGKEGVKEFYQMTQNEWNEKKRKERPTEFAPPEVYNNKREFTSMKSLECDLDDGDKSLKFSTRERKTNEIRRRKLRNINPYKNNSNTPEFNEDNSDVNEQSDNDCLITDYMQSETFTSNKNNTYEPEHPTSEVEDNDSPDHGEVSQMEPVPIRNEVEEEVFNDALLADYHKAMQDKKERSKRKGAEIAPPATFEYFGPTETKKARIPSKQINITESIEAGLKFLRKQAERKSRRRDDNIF